MSGKAVRETLGFLGVIASLVFVGWEIRQNTQVARAAAYESIGTRLADSWERLALEYPDLGRKTVLNPMSEEDIQGLSDTELTQFVALSVSILRQAEITWRQVQLGLLDEAALDYFGNDSPAGTEAGGGLSNMALMWPMIRPWMSRDFAEYLERDLGITPAAAE